MQVPTTDHLRAHMSCLIFIQFLYIITHKLLCSKSIQLKPNVVLLKIHVQNFQSSTEAAKILYFSRVDFESKILPVGPR